MLDRLVIVSNYDQLSGLFYLPTKNINLPIFYFILFAVNANLILNQFNTTMKSILIIILATIAFYAAWFFPQYMNYHVGEDIYTQILFSIVFTGFFGCFVPILIKSSNNWKYSFNQRNRSIGLFFLVLTVVIGTIFSGALSELIKLDISFIIILKYAFLFIPMSLALCLFAFMILPNFLNEIKVKQKNTLLVGSIALFFFFGFLVDTLFQDIGLAITMGILGLLFGLSYLYLRNFWIIYLSFFLTMLVNTLAENKYDDYPLWIAIISTLFSFSILFADYFGIHKQLKK